MPRSFSLEDVSPNEIAIYAVETKAIIQILWGLLLVTAITLVSVSIMVVMLRLRLRSHKKRESQLARTVAAKAQEVEHLEAKVGELAEIEEGVEELKAEVRRADAIRTKAEGRLVAQNTEIERLKGDLAAQERELYRLKKLVAHVEDF